jgi:thioesterase domain-containing protein
MPALPPLITLRTSTAAGSLWCVPGSDGDAGIFKNLAPHLPADCSAYAIDLRQLHEQAPQVSIEAIASHCVRAVRALDPRGPVHLLGYSFGGLVAYEMAVQLIAGGYRIGLLGMVDTSLVSQLVSVTARESLAAKIRRKTITWSKHLRTLIAGPQRMRWFRETVISKFFAKAYARLTDSGRAIPRWLRNVNDLNIFASTRYRPPPHRGQILLIRARDEYRDSRWTSDLGWRSGPYGAVEIRELPGTHRDLIRTESASLGRLLGDSLRNSPAADGKAPAS